MVSGGYDRFGLRMLRDGSSIRVVELAKPSFIGDLELDVSVVLLGIEDLANLNLGLLRLEELNSVFGVGLGKHSNL